MTSRPTLPSGKWHGWFSYSYDLASKHLTQLGLEIDGGHVRGKGHDEDGAYKVEGTMEPDGTVYWRKRYDKQKGGANVAYLGKWDAAAQELSGRWRIVNTDVHGKFGLKPGEAPTTLPTGGRATKDLLAELTKKWQPRCRVDLDAVRFDGEKAMLEKLLADPDFDKALRETSATQALDGEGTQAPAPGGPDRVRLNRAVLPHVFAVLDRCTEALGLTAPVELFCENDGTLNAYVITTRDDRIQVTFTSGAINALDSDELAYVMGHELGHALLGHASTRVFAGMELTGVVQLRQLALSRYQELSADRMGLLCCPDSSKALRAEFMLHSGVTLRDAIGRADAILKAAEETLGAGTTESLADEGGYSTHPYGPMRTLAIDWFARSTTFHALRGQPGGELSEAELEAKVGKLVELMNPTVLDHGGAGRGEVAELMALAALSVAEATGGASKDEVVAIRRLGKAIGEALDAAKKMSFEEQQVRVVELAEQLAMTLKPQRRHRIVEDLTVVARVDGKVSKAEQDAITSIALLLGVDAMASDDVLAEMAKGLD